MTVRSGGCNPRSPAISSVHRIPSLKLLRKRFRCESSQVSGPFLPFLRHNTDGTRVVALLVSGRFWPCGSFIPPTGEESHASACTRDGWDASYLQHENVLEICL